MKPAKEFARNEDGAILVFAAFALAVMLGMVALSFDVGRMATTQGELQAYVDNVALAAAGELDGNADAITRANNAAATLITDSQTFGTTNDRTLFGNTDFTIRYLRDLPAADETEAAAAAFVTTDAGLARYAEVVATPQTIVTPFARALAALRGSARGNTAQVGARAVAGFSSLACDVSALMFCLPSSTYRADNHIGDTILLRAGGSGAGAWEPGDFGFIDPSTTSNADDVADPGGPCYGMSGPQLDACIIGAIRNATICFDQRGIDTAPGQRNGIAPSIFNMRFDMFDTVVNSFPNGRRAEFFRPGPHVVTGYALNGQGCPMPNADNTYEEPMFDDDGNPMVDANGDPLLDADGNPMVNEIPETMAFPPDDCFASGGCTRFGDGDWSNGRYMYEYANYDYGFPDRPTGTGRPGAPAYGSTRWAYYLDEIADAAGGDILTGQPETGLPQCSNLTPVNDPSRREVIAAGVDCNALAAAGNPVNGREIGVPVQEYFRLFLMRPVESSGGNFDLFVEVIGSAGGAGIGGNSTFRDNVQLYQ